MGDAPLQKDREKLFISLHVKSCPWLKTILPCNQKPGSSHCTRWCVDTSLFPSLPAPPSVTSSELFTYSEVQRHQLERDKRRCGPCSAEAGSALGPLNTEKGNLKSYPISVNCFECLISYKHHIFSWDGETCYRKPWKLFPAELKVELFKH